MRDREGKSVCLSLADIETVQIALEEYVVRHYKSETKRDAARTVLQKIFAKRQKHKIINN